MNKVSKIVSLLLIVFLFSGCISYDDPVKEMFCEKFGNNSKYCQKEEEETPNEDDDEETEQEPSCQLSNNYNGYYADIDDDGNVDGVIFADLLKCANNDQTTISGEWDKGIYSGYNYSYNTLTKSKEYTISDTNYDGIFGLKPIISVKSGSNGNDRFYVMALENTSAESGSWHKKIGSCAGYICNYETSEDFGTGRSNTYTMINKWNNDIIGEKDNNDIWGKIQNQNKYLVTNDGITGWFVPSIDEWGAFSDVINISSSNYDSFDLSKEYWSSSYDVSFYALRMFYGDVSDGYETYNGVFNNCYIRLATTF